jgi:hypothetical protein
MWLPIIGLTPSLSGAAFSRPLERVVRPLINAGINNGEDLLKNCFRGTSNSLGFACAIINRLDLLHHHKSGDFRMIMYSYMERESPIFSGERANDGKARMLIKLSFAHDQRRSPAPLLVTRLGIKGNGNEVAFFRDVRLHLPNLSASRIAPVDFISLIIFGNT